MKRYMRRRFYDIAEEIEGFIILLRNGAGWLCQFPRLRWIASPSYDGLDRLYHWYWEHVL